MTSLLINCRLLLILYIGKRASVSDVMTSEYWYVDTASVSHRRFHQVRPLSRSGFLAQYWRITANFFVRAALRVNGAAIWRGA